MTPPPANPAARGRRAWTQINEFLEKRAKSQFKTERISGALLLGAQAVNAEAVPFSGRVDHNLLLHFWQVVVFTFVPQVVSKKDAKIERVGYVLAIPDVADLREFRRAFPNILGGLTAEHPERTPAAARIDLPEQASLEVLRKLKGGESFRRAAPRRRAGRGGSARRRARAARPTRTGKRSRLGKALMEDWGGSIRAIESYHMLKLKASNNVKLLSFARVAGRPGLVEDYEHIAKTYRNPLFRASLMRALIRDEPWHAGMIELFAEYPWPFFIEGDDTPKYLARFGRDAKDQLHAFYKDIHDMKLDEMNDEERLKQLSVIVKRLVDKYVEGRAEAKSGKKVKELPKAVAKNKDGKPLKKKNGKDLLLPVYPDPEKFRETRLRVCADAFLGMRSRHDQDFIEYFAGTICSVDHQLSHANYQFLIQTLMTNPDPNPVGEKRLTWEDVKAIAMIAISARSFQVRPRETETQRSPK